MSTLSIYIAFFCLLALLAVWLFSWLGERKELAKYKKIAQFNVYHCPKCNAVYSAYSKDKKAQCPSCKAINISMRF